MDNRIITSIKDALSQSAVPEASYNINNARLFSKDMSIDEKISLFESRAQFSGSKPHIVDSISHVKAVLLDIIPPDSLVTSSFGNSFASEIGDLKSMLPDTCEYLSSDPLETDTLFSVDIAVTDVTLAIAETGSIMICSSEHSLRMKSLVCKKHIALIQADQICSDLIDVSEYLKSLGIEEMPGGFNLISGPSKTADIELQLVIGVHGPAELHLVVIKNK